MIGRNVLHPRYGRGRVTGVTGTQLEVHFFDRNLTLPVSRQAVRFEDQGPPPTEKLARPLVEALRMGVVPASQIHEFTFGRELEADRMKEWLSDPDTPALVVAGPYGSGKTHMLEYLAGLSLQEDWAVFMCALDPVESPPHNPFRVYRALMRGFRGPGDLDSFLSNLGRRGALGEHAYFGRALRTLEEDGILEWLCGGHPGANPWGPPMFDHTTAGNLYANLLTGLSHAAHDAGLRGAVLLLDEAESVRTAWMYTYQIERGPLFLEALVRCARNDPALAGEPVSRETADPSEPYRGRRSGLLYSGHLKIPYIHRLPTHLRVAVAATPTPTLQRWAEKLSLPVIELAPLSEYALRDAFSHLVSLYRLAHPGFRPPVFERQTLFRFLFRRMRETGMSARGFFKGAVEALDLLRFGRYPESG